MFDKPIIVFVDDEENVLKSLERLFFDFSHQIHTFSSGEEALNQISDLDPDIIVVDQMMPGMKGTEFLEKAYELSPTSNFLMLTAYPEYGLVAKALNEGNICHFLSKPWDDAEFVNLIERVMENRRQEMTIMYEMTGMKISNEEMSKRVEYLKNQVKNRVQVILAKNKELYQSSKALEGNLWDTIRIFFSMLQVKNPEVGEHCIRVSKLALFFGRKLKLSEKELTILEISSLLHDIGKIALPEYLLERKLQSSSEEEDLLAMHPLVGQYSFYNINPLKEIGLTIRHHHEKWNGTGFPDKLKTNAVPFMARLLSICNVYDNLFYTQFKYHPTKKERILSKMLNEAGVSLDPDLTKLFVSHIAEIDELEEMEKNVDKLLEYNPVKLLDIAIEKLYEEEKRIRDGSIKIVKVMENIPNITCYPIKLREMFYNLIKNSVEAIPSRGKVRVVMSVSNQYVNVEIEDDGLGIDQKDLENMFMPGFTTKDSRTHEGMGLTKFYEGLKAHQAKLELKSEPGRGTTFKISIPIN